MQIPRKPAQTTTLNSFSIHSAIITSGVVFGYISPWWLALSVPMMLMAFTAESNLKRA